MSHQFKNFHAVLSKPLNYSIYKLLYSNFYSMILLKILFNCYMNTSKVFGKICYHLISLHYSVLGYSVIENIVANNPNESYSPNSWQSLSEDEANCVLNVLPNVLNATSHMKSFNICNTALCIKYCKNSELFLKHIENPEMRKLLHYSTHPAKFNKEGTWTVPFCAQGNDVQDLLDKIEDDNTMMNVEEEVYGYKFCQNVENRFTDIGMCTTFDYFIQSDNEVK